MGQFVSDPLLEDFLFTTSHTVSIVNSWYQAAATYNSHIALLIRVVQSDDSTIRGTLFSRLATTATEFSTSAQTRIISAAALSGLQCYKGDRIVIEIGAYNASPTGSGSMTWHYGTSNLYADYALTSGLTTALNGWVELSPNLPIGPGNSNPGSATVLTTGNFKTSSSAFSLKSIYVKKVKVYLDNTGTSHAACYAKAFLYTSSSDAPNALVAVSDELAIADNQAAGWQEFTFSAPLVPLTAGTKYFIGLIVSTNGLGIRYYKSTSGHITGTVHRHYYYGDTYSDGPADPFGSASNANSISMCAYVSDAETPTATIAVSAGAASCAITAEYTSTDRTATVGVTGAAAGCAIAASNYSASIAVTAPPISTFGYSSIEASTDDNYANVRVSNKYTLTEDGDVSGIYFYLSNQASGNGSCYARAFIYSDVAGTPTALKGLGSETNIAANQAAGWVYFPFATPVALTAATYWIGFHGDANCDGIRLYYKTIAAGSCSIESYTYTSGTPDPYGFWGSSGRTWQYGVYANYIPSSKKAGVAIAASVSMGEFTATVGVTGAAAGTAITAYNYGASLAVTTTAASCAIEAKETFEASLAVTAAAASTAIEARVPTTATIGVTGAAAGASINALQFTASVVLTDSPTSLLQTQATPIEVTVSPAIPSGYQIDIYLYSATLGTPALFYCGDTDGVTTFWSGDTSNAPKPLGNYTRILLNVYKMPGYHGVYQLVTPYALEIESYSADVAVTGAAAGCAASATQFKFVLEAPADDAIIMQGASVPWAFTITPAVATYVQIALSTGTGPHWINYTLTNVTDTYYSGTYNYAPEEEGDLGAGSSWVSVVLVGQGNPSINGWWYGFTIVEDQHPVTIAVTAAKASAAAAAYNYGASITAGAAAASTQVTAEETFSATIGVAAEAAGVAIAANQAIDFFDATVAVTAAAASVHIEAERVQPPNTLEIGVAAAAAGAAITAYNYRAEIGVTAAAASASLAAFMGFTSDITAVASPAGVQIEAIETFSAAIALSAGAAGSQLTVEEQFIAAIEAGAAAASTAIDMSAWITAAIAVQAAAASVDIEASYTRVFKGVKRLTAKSAQVEPSSHRITSECVIMVEGANHRAKQGKGAIDGFDT